VLTITVTVADPDDQGFTRVDITATGSNEERARSFVQKIDSAMTRDAETFLRDGLTIDSLTIKAGLAFKNRST
jgi:hypothetical protein